MHRHEFKNALARAAGDAPDAGAVAAAAIDVWQSMAARLIPVIGAQGVDVLFRRALLLTSRVFVWLAAVKNDEDADALQESLRHCLASQEVSVAMEASVALLIRFSELLTSLIGEALTERLLELVWAAPPPHEGHPMKNKTVIQTLATGVPGLDEILGGGLPEYSLNLIVGPPGSGKTTLAHQIMFSLATPARPALFITILGEPPLKMLRYQQQFAFFDDKKIDTAIRFVDLSADMESGSLDQVQARIRQEVEASSPALVFVDSFRALTWGGQNRSGDALGMQSFIQQLGILLSSWQVTTFLIGKDFSERAPHPIFTIADGLLLLEQSVYRNSMVRKIQVMKMRGQALRPGVHTFRITAEGLKIYAAALAPDDSGERGAKDAARHERALLAMGNATLDSMLGGGLPAGYSLLVAGPSGSGKTILATAFLAEGVRCGEAGVIVAFEQTPSQSHTRTIDDLVRAGKIGLINSRALDLSIEEIVQRLIMMIDKMKAKRVVIDSLSGFELAVAPAFREDFREALFRLVAVLSGLGVAVLLTSELEDRYIDLRFSPYGAAFLTDAIIVQRYIEIESQLKRVMAVIKMRARNHSKEIREYEIDDAGIAIGAQVLGFDGLFSGRPMRVLPPVVLEQSK